MTPGSPILTKSGRRGIVVIPPGSAEMPHHALIEFPDGPRLWIVRDALSDQNPLSQQKTVSNPTKTQQKGNYGKSYHK